MQVRCLIHTEEAYKLIKASYDIMDHYAIWIGANGGDRALARGLRYGCYEWEAIFPEDRGAIVGEKNGCQPVDNFHNVRIVLKCTGFEEKKEN